MSPNEFARAIDQKRRALEREVLVAERRTAAAAKSAFVKQSSGTMTGKQRRMLGYPYSVRNPHPGVDPTYINAITGEFRRKWVITTPQAGRGMRIISIVNVDPKAIFMFGTRLMVARRIDKRIAEIIEPIRTANLRAALARALRA